MRKCDGVIERSSAGECGRETKRGRERDRKREREGRERERMEEKRERRVRGGRKTA